MNIKKRSFSFQREAWPIQKFVKACCDSVAVGSAAIVVKKDDGRVFCSLVGGSNPVPASSSSGRKTKTGTQLILVGQLVQGLHVQGLETVDRPTFWPPTLFARVLQL